MDPNNNRSRPQRVISLWEVIIIIIIAQQGTKRQKIQNIDQVVYKNFLNAREQYLPIHDIDIQRWG